MNRMNEAKRPELNRRTLLASLAALCGLGALQGKFASTKSGKAHHALASRVVRVLGLAHTLRSIPRADTEDLLASVLGVDQEALGRLADISDNALRNRLRALRLADYSNGRLVAIEGWWLANTEAQAMVLAARLSGNEASPAWYAVTAWHGIQQQSHG